MNSSTREGRALPWALVTPALGWTLLFFVLPFVAMGLSSLRGSGDSSFSLANYSQFFANPAYWQAMVNSLEVTAIVTVVSVLLAYPFAWILAEQVPERWQRAALMLAVLPFWTSYVVRSYSWLLVLSQNGVINRALVGSGLLSEPLQLANTRFATVTGFVHFFVMLLTLTIFANLKQLSPSYRKAAADLGAGPARTFWHVILPLTLPGIMVGAFLTFVLCIGDYITPQILGGNNELVMPQLVMMQIGRRGDFPLASALSIILMAVVTVAYLACARWLKIERT
ncbi:MULTISPECIES: ABC transporter permease [unclassified Mesorhizobium]|uniref:ABC transporter permease n=1 Tax=unclassified Mesorhizobium TaxID=325217 RepID=UPI00086F3CF3|nr:MULTISPECIES: ABC transporter permease [unclassified Mesorhizobium]MBN9258168.1 ABC transporter permease [Mesorhizobium sp.]MBN9271166.1 ABC transporter permease [Mesorhizobium sp.]ODT20787.1 MAG: spermidine/putrescine ABC transporter permease [Mesorhizobium sp. SCN 65-12]OJX74555.1 MAG: spermidine/putrescine ABC transporter permease [Mesorhizobium sp. 65-26]